MHCDVRWQVDEKRRTLEEAAIAAPDTSAAGSLDFDDDE
jgi:hypothetical protein